MTGSPSKPVLYEVVSSHRGLDGSYIIVVKVCNTVGKVFKINAVELISDRKDLLGGFSVDDVVSIVGIASNQQSSVLFHKKIICYRYYVVFAMLFIALLLMANITSVKLISVMGYPLSMGIFAYMLMYSIGNIIAEVYGYKRMRFVIWIAVGIQLFNLFYLKLTTITPTVSAWVLQGQYDLVMERYIPNAVGASIISVLVSEFVNAYIISRMKLICQGRHLFSRIFYSSIVGILVNSALFVVLTYKSLLSGQEMFSLFLDTTLFKLIFEFASMPWIVGLIKYVKKKENIDIYDHSTRFNPFSFDIEYTEANNRSMQ